MINNMSRVNIRNVLVAYTSIFICFFLYSLGFGYRENIPTYMLALQLYYMISYTCVCVFSVYLKKSRSEIFALIFFFNLLSAIIVRVTSWTYLNEPFLGGVDSITYDAFGNQVVTQNMNISTYIQSIYNSLFLKLDDFGMLFIVYFVYDLFGGGIISQNALLFLNVIVIVVCSIKLDKILQIYNIQATIRRFCVVAFSCFPFLSLTAAVGLKENFFVFILINAFYNFIAYKECHKKKYLFGALFFTILILFFRIATFVMIAIMGIVVLISNDYNKKKILFLFIGGSFLGFILMDSILGFLYNKSLEDVLATTDHRSESMSSMGGYASFLINGLSVLVGPFPNFSKASEYAIVHSSGVMMKVILNFFALLGIWHTIKKYDYKFFGILVYFIMNFMMLVMAGVALDMRYQIILFPILMPLIATMIQNNRHVLLFLLYCFFLFFIIGFYNNR